MKYLPSNFLVDRSCFLICLFLLDAIFRSRRRWTQSSLGSWLRRKTVQYLPVTSTIHINKVIGSESKEIQSRQHVKAMYPGMQIAQSILDIMDTIEGDIFFRHLQSWTEISILEMNVLWNKYKMLRGQWTWQFFTSLKTSIINCSLTMNITILISLETAIINCSFGGIVNKW